MQSPRDPQDERRLAIRLTAKGQDVVARDTVLRPDALAKAMRKLDQETREALLIGLERLAEAADGEAM
jgi:DNA-binding MarR family transcriptional regulator